MTGCPGTLTKVDGGRTIGMAQRSIAFDEVVRSLDLAAAWVEERGYRGHEPFDGRASWLRPLPGGEEVVERILVETRPARPVEHSAPARRAPLGLHEEAGLHGVGYLTLHRTTGRPEYPELAAECLEWLDRHKACRDAGKGTEKRG